MADRVTIFLDKEWRGTKSTTFTGRPQGEQVRDEKVLLDEKDLDSHNYEVVIPNDTTAFNSSFYLGLFFPSIEKFKTLVNFDNKYLVVFEDGMDEKVKEKLNEDIEDSRRQAMNDLEDLDSDGFWS